MCVCTFGIRHETKSRQVGSPADAGFGTCRNRPAEKSSVWYYRLRWIWIADGNVQTRGMGLPAPLSLASAEGHCIVKPNFLVDNGNQAAGVWKLLQRRRVRIPRCYPGASARKSSLEQGAFIDASPTPFLHELRTNRATLAGWIASRSRDLRHQEPLEERTIPVDAVIARRYA